MPKITDNGIDYLQSQNAEYYAKEAIQLRRHDRSLRLIPDNIEQMELVFYTRPYGKKPSIALQKAIDAINDYQEKRTR